MFQNLDCISPGFPSPGLLFSCVLLLVGGIVFWSLRTSSFALAAVCRKWILGMWVMIVFLSSSSLYFLQSNWKKRAKKIQSKWNTAYISCLLVVYDLNWSSRLRKCSLKDPSLLWCLSFDRPWGYTDHCIPKFISHSPGIIHTSSGEKSHLPFPPNLYQAKKQMLFVPSFSWSRVEQSVTLSSLLL